MCNSHYTQNAHQIPSSSTVIIHVYYFLFPFSLNIHFLTNV